MTAGPLVSYRSWHRILKLDPGRHLTQEAIAGLGVWQPDALVIGGSGGYGVEEVLALRDRSRGLSLPVCLEVSDPGVVVPGFDLYLIPMVLNTLDVDWLIGHHQQALKRWGGLIDWELVLVEGYCILNPDSAAARLASAKTNLSEEDVVAFAQVAEHLLRLPIFYLEYSGNYGPPSLAHAVSRVLSETLLWYGGGIETAEQASEMANYSDGVVVGNAIYRPSTAEAHPLQHSPSPSARYT